MKTLKNIEGKNEVKMIKNDLNKAKKKKNVFKMLNFINKLGSDAKEIFYKIKELDKEIDYAKLVCVHTNRDI